MTSLDELLFRNHIVKFVFGEFSPSSWHKRMELNPYAEGGKYTFACACESALEIAIGYGIGYVAQRILC